MNVGGRSEWSLQGQVTRCGCSPEEIAAQPDPWKRHLKRVNGQPVCHKPRKVEPKKLLATSESTFIRRSTRRLLRLLGKGV